MGFPPFPLGLTESKGWVLFTWNLQSSFFSFRRKGVDLDGLSLRERKFDLRERLDVKALGGRFGGLERRVDKRLKMEGVGGYL